MYPFADRKFLVLSGQHSTKAMMILREEYMKERGAEHLPEPMTGVRADVVHHEINVETRKLIAGTEQYKQEGIARIPLSNFAARLLETKADPYGAGLVKGIAEAVAKTGFRRPEDQACSIRSVYLTIMFICLHRPPSSELMAELPSLCST